MIYFSFNIANPVRFGKKLFDYDICYHRKLTKNKSFEFQFSLWDYDYQLFEIVLDLIWWGTDHAGPRFEFSIFGIRLDLKIYDNRHWDYSNNTWEIYPENIVE